MHKPNPLLILQARAEARAMLYAASEFDLADALKPLVDYALDSGIIREIGSEATFAIIHKPFKEIAAL